jgi:cytochrome P450
VSGPPLTAPAPSRPRLPEPRGFPVFGHLPRWAASPLELLEEGARLGPVFGLRLGLRAVVGTSPAWNRLVLGDLETFRSRGSLSGVVPYLAGGVILTDAPAHKARRAELNAPYHRGSLEALRARSGGCSRRSPPAATLRPAPGRAGPSSRP